MPKELYPVNERELKSLIREKATHLNLGSIGINGEVLLAAICYKESTFGKNNRPRVEKAYSPGGRYYRGAEHVRQAFEQYGEDAASSWGPWQILYITALELGYKGEPRELSDPKVSIDWVIRLINKRILGRGASSLEEIADAYNSGSFVDEVVPTEYIEGFIEAYNGLAREWINDY